MFGPLYKNVYTLCQIRIVYPIPWGKKSGNEKIVLRVIGIATIIGMVRFSLV